MSWDSSASTVRYLANCTVESEGDFYHRHSISGYSCKCGATHNLWNGPPSFCGRCGNVIVTHFNFGPFPFETPDYGPSLLTIQSAITFRRYTALPA
jgi:hypothetical protein